MCDQRWLGGSIAEITEIFWLISFARCRMAFARATEAYADEGSIQPAIERLGKPWGNDNSAFEQIGWARDDG